MASMYARARVLVEGSVQGVGFRNFVRSRANAQRVTGWVRNLDDGRVEAVFEGEKADIERLIEICKRGSVFARVKDIRVLWEDEFERFSSFSIKHD